MLLLDVMVLVQLAVAGVEGIGGRLQMRMMAVVVVAKLVAHVHHVANAPHRITVLVIVLLLLFDVRSRVVTAAALHAIAVVVGGVALGLVVMRIAVVVVVVMVVLVVVIACRVVESG